jgi:hypothetical protein
MDARARGLNVDVCTRVYLWLRSKVSIVYEGMDSWEVGAWEKGSSPPVAILGKVSSGDSVNKGGYSSHVGGGSSTEVGGLI